MVIKSGFLLLCLWIFSGIYAVEENNDEGLPVIFTGNTTLRDFQLRNAASREFERFAQHQREADLFDASYSILQHLRNKGYYFARVNYTYIPDKQQATSVLFTISEGQSVTIDDIEITGAETWKKWNDEDITHTIGSPIKGLLKHIGVGDLVFRQQDVDNAINSITTAYLLHGYQRVQVGPAEFKWRDNKSKVRILIPVKEGPKFIFSSMRIENDRSGSNISAKKLQGIYKDINLTGSAFHPRLLREKIGIIRRRLNDDGYLEAAVDGNYTFDKENNSAKANIMVKPGPQFLFSELILKGKQQTRRSLFTFYTRRMEKNKRIRYYRIEESISYLYRTGVFESIRWSTVKKTVNPDGTIHADIVLDVKELPRNYVDFTLGYGSYEQLRSGITYHNRNLFGIGLEGEIGYDLSVKSQRLESSLFWGEYYRKQFIILQTAWEEREEPSYDSTIFDAQLRYRQLHGRSDDMEWLIGYNFEDSEASNVVSGADVDSEGTVIISSIEMAETIEKRDDLFNPTEGFRLRGNVEWSSPDIGSDLEFLRYEGVAQFYFPFGDGPDFVVATNLRVNTYDLHGDTTTLPIQKRLFLGGENSVRSFKRHELGPVNTDGDPIGGLSSALASIEVRFPLIPDYNLSGAVFWDGGLVDEHEMDFDADIGQAVGVGIRFDLPIGPIRLDAATHIGDEFASDEDIVVHFSLGFSF